MSNIYHDKLAETYWDNQMTAERLLNVMRGIVEPVLQKYEKGRHCKSQSQRARIVGDYIQNELRRPRKELLSLNWRELYQDRDVVNNFLAVHRTVWILEGRAL